MYLGSDALALAPFTDEVTYLEDGDWAVLSRRRRRDPQRRPASAVERPAAERPARRLLAEKGNYRHFMAKEIHEQPEVVGRTLAHYVDFAAGRVCLPVHAAVRLQGPAPACRSRPAAPPIYAGLIAKYWFERLARLPVEIDVASEFRYREAPLRAAAAWRCSSRNRARPPTRSPRCATPRRQGSTSSRSSTCRPRPSPARARSSRRRWPARRSASPRPRPSPASSRCSSASPSRRAARAARSSERDEKALVDALIAVPSLMAEALKREHADRAARARPRQGDATCSISAAAPPIRWRSRAR